MTPDSPKCQTLRVRRQSRRITLLFTIPRVAIEPGGVVFCRLRLPFLLPSRSDRTKRSYFFPLMVAVSIAGFRCRFSLPFGRSKPLRGRIPSESDTSGKAGGLENHGLLKAGRWDRQPDCPRPSASGDFSCDFPLGRVAGRWDRQPDCPRPSASGDFSCDFPLGRVAGRWDRISLRKGFQGWEH
jgi:hypothetical protein